MPQPNRKATQAKQQRSTERSNFVSPPKDIDSGSVYNSSSDEDSSSDESVDATKKLFLRNHPSHLQHQLVSFQKIVRLSTWLPDRLQASMRGLWFIERTLKGLITATRNTGKKPHRAELILGPSSHWNPCNWCQNRKRTWRWMTWLQPDPVKEIAVELWLDLLDFCINQLEDDCAMIMPDMEVDENKFEVSVKITDARIELTNLSGTDCWNWCRSCIKISSWCCHRFQDHCNRAIWSWSCSWMAQDWWWRCTKIYWHLCDCQKVSKGHEEIEMWTYCEDDDAANCGIRVCEALRSLPSPWQIQEAMSKCQSCNCSLNGKRLPFCTTNLSEQGIPSSTPAIATIEGKS